MLSCFGHEALAPKRRVTTFPAVEDRLKITAKTDSDRFQSDAGKYAAFQKAGCASIWPSPTCRILPPAKDSLRALDLGGGTTIVMARS